MTCAHVLGLIDAGPFADYPQAHLDAAWQHARQCATCGPALEAAAALSTALSALPQLAAPPDLAAAVLARIARGEAVQLAPAPSVTPEWSPWVTTLGGLGAGLAIVLSVLGGEVVPIAITSGFGGLTGVLSAMPVTTTWAPALAVSLALYAAGLFSPVRGRRSP